MDKATMMWICLVLIAVALPLAAYIFHKMTQEVMELLMNDKNQRT